MLPRLLRFLEFKEFSTKQFSICDVSILDQKIIEVINHYRELSGNPKAMFLSGKENVEYMSEQNQYSLITNMVF